MTTAAQVLEQYERDLKYYYAHYDELLAQHPEEWVVIYGERLVGTGEDLPELLDILRDQGIPPERSVVKNPSSEQEIWILPERAVEVAQ